MAATNPTPPSEDAPPTTFASYVPHDLPYNGSFEDSLISIVLSDAPTSAADPGIRIISSDSTEQPVQGQSVRHTDISPQSLPTINESDLPLPLDDPRRIFASSVPGIKTTHPGGYLEGGPGLDPEMDTFPEDFVANHGGRIRGRGDLESVVGGEVERCMEELRARMRRRKEAKERNEQVEKDLKALVDQHGMEMKSLQRMAEEAKRKKEVREKRRGGSEG